jgi:nucleoside phosphorylase
MVSPVISTIFVPRGAEADAVRRAAARARSNVRVVETGIGPIAAARAADEALARAPVGTVLVTGLCGLLSPSFAVGDALVYGEIARGNDGAALALARDLGGALAAKIPNAQTGIRALASERIVTSAREKTELGERTHADAVDMESLAIVERLQQRNVPVAVVRVASDGSSDTLPELDRALDGAGGMDGLALALAMLRHPALGIRLAFNGTRALRALRDCVEALLR